MESDDRRSFTRIDTELEVDVITASGQQLSCRTRDVSYCGVFLTTETQLAQGEAVDFTVWLGARGTGLGLRIEGVVAHTTEHGVGIQINEIAHTAYEHLRRLIVLNSPDPVGADQQIMRKLGLGESA